MRIFAESIQENEMLDEVAAFLKSKGIPHRKNRYEDSFGLIVWSIDDARSCGKKAAYDMTDEEAVKFLQYANRGLKDALVMSGNDSIADLFDDYLREKNGLQNNKMF